MRGRIWTTAVGLASVAALIAVPSALAAYTTPKLEVRLATGSVVLKASQGIDDDATARAEIRAPAGITTTTTQAPGAIIGQVQALVIATALGNAQLPIEGTILVAAPGQVPPETVAACLGPAAAPAATWLMALSAAGQAINLPMYLTASPVAIVVCLPHPSLATFGAKLVSAEFSVTGVFSTGVGAWISIWTPYSAAGPVNAAGTVASPAAAFPGAVTAAARRAGNGATVTGRVTQAGTARPGATVAIFGGPRANRLRRLGRVRTNAQGTFTFRARTGTFFRATATGAAGAAPPLCTAIAAQLAPIPCVNPTVTGFTAQSRVVRKR